MNRMPKLRFKEFNIKWEEKKLGDITKFSKGKLISKEDITETGIECIRYGELYTTYGEVITKIVSKTNLNVKDLVLSEENDIIIPSSGETAIDIAKASCVTKSGVALSGDLNILKLNENGIFLSYYLNNKLKYQIASLAQGASVVHLYENHLKKLKVLFPSLKEQQKIADFLSSIDKKISITEEKLDLFKEYKKGIMQKIFNQELKFKDNNGNDYPEWEEKILGEVSSFINGKGHEQFIDENGNYIVVNSKFISSDGLVKKYTSNLLVPLYVNDILMVMSDVPNGKAIGKCFLVNENNKYSLNQRICALRTVENSKYLYYFLNRNSYFLKFDDGISQTNLKKDEVLSCPIFLPCLEEQQKIADFLSSIDNKIDNLATELEDLKEFKKGLLQQMFV